MLKLLSKQDIITTWNLTKMRVQDQYLGSILGALWVLLKPSLQLGLYVFVFGFIFKAKAPGADTTFAYSIWMISGFVPYMAFAEALTLTASSVLSSSSIVKNLVFKTELIPISAVFSAMVPFFVGICFLFILVFIDGNYPTWHIAVLPIVFVLQTVFLCSVGFFLAAASVFLRDILQALPTLTMLMLFFTPIFYPRELMPNIVQKLTFFNPLFQMTAPYRVIFIDHALPDWRGLVYLTVLSCVLFALGWTFFRRLKGYFEVAL